jgi:predicted enzyme related to lactoylglutathione lyase
VIAAGHVLIYADDAEKARAFFRDVIGWEHVDAHDGWLIFALPPAELGFHPTGGETPPSGRHELFLMCRDIEQTVAELKGKGVELTKPIEDEGFGLVTAIEVPGARQIQIYQPKHASPLAEFQD